MLTASAELTVQIEGVAQRVAGRLTIYLPASPYVDFTRALRSVQLTAQMTTDVPDGVRDVAGLSTLTGDIVVGGSVDPHGDATKTAEWLFNPDSPDSPLRHLTVNGCKITFEDGLYVDGSATPEFLPASGDCWINGYDLDHEAGEVTFHVTSLGPEWDAQPGIGSVATLPPFNAGLTSEYVMDAVIRGMYGASSWPAQRPGCVLAVGFRSTIWPEVGTLVTAGLNPEFTFTPGLWGSAVQVVAGGNVPEYVFDAIDDDVTTVFATGPDFILNILGSGTADTIAIVGSGGDLTVTLIHGVFTYDTYTFAGALAGAPEYVGVHVHWPIGSTSWSVTLRAGGTTYTSGTRTYVGSARSQQMVTAFLGSAGQFEAWQITPESAPSWPDFTPLAVLDPSLNPMTVVPPFATDAKGWDLLQQAAGAELGYIRKDRDGVIRFSNRQTLANQAAGRTIGQTSLLGLATSVPPSGSFRTVQVPYTAWDFDDDPTSIYILGGRKKIPAKSTVTWRPSLGSDITVAAITETVTLLPDGGNSNDGGSYYRSSGDKAGATAGPKLNITAKLINSTTIEISVQNPSGRDAYLTTPATFTDFTAGAAGTGLWIGGYLALRDNEATVQCVYGDGIGTLDVPSNAFLQDHDTAVDLGDWLLNQLFMDVRDYTNVSLVPDLRIDPGDLHRLDNPAPSGVDEYVSVWGWQYSAEFPPAGQPGGSREQTINVRALGAPDAWLIGGITDRGDINVDAWLYV